MEKISAFKRKADIASDIEKVKSMKHFTSLYGGSIDQETVYILEEPSDQEKPGEKQAFDGMLWEELSSFFSFPLPRKPDTSACMHRHCW